MLGLKIAIGVGALFTMNSQPSERGCEYNINMLGSVSWAGKEAMFKELTKGRCRQDGQGGINGALNTGQFAASFWRYQRRGCPWQLSLRSPRDGR
jgi:hypothetical protein